MTTPKQEPLPRLPRNSTRRPTFSVDTVRLGNHDLAVNLRGRLTEVVFLQNNVPNLTDRHTLAEQLTAAATAARAAASAVVGEISAVHHARLG
ncbi:hypothetical protein [Glycomyces rhizosphaerae]|uniref:Uncharacterized protein n=1 Tax=Glycomyces rhizosphaerae TaxID=2054422 RepID=A0ABV7PXZ6_9ACTN